MVTPPSAGGNVLLEMTPGGKLLPAVPATQRLLLLRVLMNYPKVFRQCLPDLESLAALRRGTGERPLRGVNHPPVPVQLGLVGEQAATLKR